MQRGYFIAALGLALVMAGAVPALAADEPKTIDAADGAFGFADDSGATDVGKFQSTLDFLPSWNNGRMRGTNVGARLEINTGVLPGLQLGLAATGANERSGPTGEDVNTSRAFSVSLPGKWQIRAREVNDFGIGITFEPFIGRERNRPQPGGLDYGIDAKIVLDANFGNRIYATFNAGYALEATAPPVGGTQTAGQLYLSLAGTYRFFDALYVGLQIRQAWQYQQAGPGSLAGQSLSLGPTIAWQVNDNLTFSAVWMRQVAGSDVVRPSALLDLTNFHTNDARVRMTVSF